MTDREHLLKAFASSINIKRCVLNELSKDNKKDRQRVLESISDDIKKCTNFIAPEVSRAASDKYKALGIGDLRTKDWHDQPKFDANRKLFHLEHIIPVSVIRENCLNASSESTVFEILRTRLRAVWILEEEDCNLNRLGYRFKRNDPQAAYEEAGICLIPRAETV